MRRLAVVSDTHLSAANPKADLNWEAVLRHIEATSPDLVLHSGDISASGSIEWANLDYARAQLDRLPVPWRAVPGNHDLGGSESDRALTIERRLRYEDVFGPRFWSIGIGPDGIGPGGIGLAGPRWCIVGLDSQALTSGHPDDEIWWAWTADQLATGRPTLVILHLPIGPTGPDEVDAERRYLTEPHRTRLARLLADAGTVRVVVSGHTHQWRSQVVDGIHRIWTPSTWSMIADERHPIIGQKVLGLVELDLGGIGIDPGGIGVGAHAGSDPAGAIRLVRPDGLVDNVHGGAPSHRPTPRPTEVVGG